ncbi:MULTISPECIES: hypothetical protein [Pseudovibrio]|uniref:hypothetical protein n=1 Tax=Stappiaceae TaxID=2821832 RepID=UPI002366C75B|nr:MULTISPECIES: hypothetical protein [Pseudovibrio]MDD7909386.1 hypothetical protein [Pseudovibrio exalbescens]MDX5594945.1 hypothetical protein [Pseudovibrio sp. SPO723]
MPKPLGVSRVLSISFALSVLASASWAQMPSSPVGPAGGGFTPSYGSGGSSSFNAPLGAYPEALGPASDRPVGAYPDATVPNRKPPEVVGIPKPKNDGTPLVIPFGNRADPNSPNADREGAGNIK